MQATALHGDFLEKNVGALRDGPIGLSDLPHFLNLEDSLNPLIGVHPVSDPWNVLGFFGLPRLDALRVEI
jgi:hypothetical protein